MTPAEQLRAAAEKLRTLATAASTDRHGRDTSTWTSHHVNERDARLYGPDRVRIIRGSSIGAHGRGAHPHLAPAHADYAAAMDPAVGLAVADWLDSAAIDAEQIGPDHHALATARALLGGEPR